MSNHQNCRQNLIHSCRALSSLHLEPIYFRQTVLGLLQMSLAVSVVAVLVRIE